MTLPRRKPPRKKRVPKRTTLRNKADKLFSLIIRAEGKCAYCGTTEGLTAAHIVGRRHYSVRWSFENALPLCWPDHHRFTLNPVAWNLWVVSIIGEREWWRLHHEAQKKWDGDYAALLERLEKRLAELDPSGVGR